MPRKPEPWYWEKRNGWYVQINGKHVFLGEHPAGAAKPEKNKKGRWNAPESIDDAFHKLMLAPTVVASGTVWEVFDAMLGWTLANRARRTYDFYKERLQQFKDEVPNMIVEKLTPDHVYTWINKKKWSDTYKRGCMTTLCRAFNWAVKARKIPFNPIAGIEKPEASHRETLITPKEFEKVLKLVKDESRAELRNLVAGPGGVRRTDGVGCRRPSGAATQRLGWSLPERREDRAVFAGLGIECRGAANSG